MLRLLLLGLMLVGLATGLHREWLVVDWVKLMTLDWRCLRMQSHLISIG